MKQNHYPSLYHISAEHSRKARLCYMWLTGLQYTALFLAATVALYFEFIEELIWLYIALVLCSICISIYDYYKGSEKTWYGFRALAESIKTATWKYMMNAEPFNGKNEEAKKKFVEHLKEIVTSNNQVIESSVNVDLIHGEATDKMVEVRNLPLAERKEFYFTSRIDDQYTWYVKKASNSNKNYILLLVICVILQCLAISLAAFYSFCFSCHSFLMFQPILVLVAGIFGWIKMAKYKELASSYSLTAYEISIIKSKFTNPRSEKQFIKFVNEVEHVFSKEHTQWVARRKG